MKLLIEDDEGNKRSVPFVGSEVTIGRDENNTVRLPDRNVSRHHARLTRQNGHVLVEDLGSYNGIFVNGERIRSAVPVRNGDHIRIGDYDLALLPESGVDDSVDGPTPLNGLTRPPPPPPPSIPPSAAPTLVDIQAPLPPPPPAPLRPTSLLPSDNPTLEIPHSPVRELDPAHAPRLVVLNTALAGREFACIRTALRLGRADDTDNDICLDHRSLSRAHALLTQTPAGEWRLVDLQSANGMLVNGEPYREATLQGGDVLTLGHVRLKFLQPGDRFAFVPEEVLARRAMLKKAGAGLVLVAALGGVTYAALRLTSGRRASARSHRLAPVATQAPPATSLPLPAPAPAAPVDPLAAARKALSSGDFSAALTTLQEAHPSEAGNQRVVQALLATAQHEVAVERTLKDAEAALDGGHVAEARRLVDGLHTEYQRPRLGELYRRLEVPRAAVSPRGAAVPAEDRAEDAPVLFETGKVLLRNRDYSPALVYFDRCLKADPRYLHCEAFLGAAYIDLNQPDQGAFHYRHFAEHAPRTDPAYARELEQVRQRLQQYEQELNPPARPKGSLRRSSSRR